MERSTKFLSLSGWAGIMAGVYATLGVIHVHLILGFSLNADESITSAELLNDPVLRDTTITALLVLVLALFTAVFLSWKQSIKTGNAIWNTSAKRLVYSMTVPLLTGGIFILALLSNGMIAWIPVTMLLFYGLALYNASVYTIDEVKYLGFYQIILGLWCAFNTSLGLWFWLAGFGFGHIVYGTYMYIRYER